MLHHRAVVEFNLENPVCPVVAGGFDAATADRIAAGLVDRLAQDATEAQARVRLTQSLADIPGDTASHALTELSQDADRAVALTATYLLQLREARRPSSAT